MIIGWLKDELYESLLVEVASEKEKTLTANVQIVTGSCWAQRQLVHIRGESKAL